MYLESIIGYNDGKGNDVVGHGYDFRLKLHPWQVERGKKWNDKNHVQKCNAYCVG